MDARGFHDLIAAGGGGGGGPALPLQARYVYLLRSFGILHDDPRPRMPARRRCRSRALPRRREHW
jgi:hypothetical protein